MPSNETANEPNKGFDPVREVVEYNAILTANERLSERFCRLTFRCPEIAREAKPGQFVNLETKQYLRRPLAVATTTAEEFTVGIEIKGEGTRQLSELVPGDEVNVLGPLGHGFNLQDAEQIVVVGGGTGIFPLQLALQEARKQGLPTAACFGFRSRDESFLLDELASQSDETFFTSDAGDLGIPGTVMEALKQVEFKPDARIFCVGPKPMMISVSHWAEERGIPCEVSIEEHMACGIGLCLTCVCKVQDGDEIKNVRSCMEGPVFDSRRIIWR